MHSTSLILISVLPSYFFFIRKPYFNCDVISMIFIGHLI